MQKKIVAIGLIAALTASMFTACGGKAEETASSADSTSQTSAGMANPNQYDLSEKDAEKITGITLQAPKKAEDVKYNVIEAESDHPIMEIEFKLDGNTYYMRAETTTQTSVYPDEMGMDDEGEAGDNSLERLSEIEELADKEDVNISGICGSWDTFGTELIGELDAVMCGSSDGSFIAWVDPDQGLLCNVCTTEDVDDETLVKTAGQVSASLK